jgi:enoyl-CoA hydratase
MIEISKSPDIWTLSINRPEKANSVTEAMLTELADAVEQASAAAKVLILTGEGKVFSAGADLEAAKAGLAVSPVWERLSGAIASFPGLSIAALNGTVAGGSTGMVLACDIRISVPNAKFFYPVMKLGFLPQPSDPKRMRNLIGPSRTKLILMGGQKIVADEALEWGLIDQIVAQDELLETANGLASDVLAAEPAHIHGIKSLID